VQLEPRRSQYIAEKIYTYLDKNDAAQVTSIDGAHPTAAGHRIMAEMVAGEVLGMFGKKP